MVLRFAIYALSVQRVQDGIGWKGTRERRWVVVWAEYRHGRDQIIGSKLPGCIARHLGRGRHHIHPPNLRVSASYRDGRSGGRRAHRYSIEIDCVNPIYYETIKLAWRAGILRHHTVLLLWFS